MTQRKTAATNGSPATNGARKPTASLEVRVTQLEDDLKLQAWLYAELVYSVRVAFAQLALANPQVQQQLAARLVQQGGQL